MSEKLRQWQEKHRKNRAAYLTELTDMQVREEYYAGTDRIQPMQVCRDFKQSTGHVRNIAAELIESQVDSTIPQPKVQARREEDEPLARIIETMLRNEMDRLPFEVMNDQLARTVPIQGGAGFLVEWDAEQRTHETVGELSVSALHPSVIIPQAGVYTGIEDMDYIFVEVPQTRESIKARYGADVETEREEHPEDRGDATTAEDMVTQICAYYRNEDGGIGLYSWVGDTELEDLDNYQARRARKCAECGAPEPGDIRAEGTETEKVCPRCGGTRFVTDKSDYEQVMAPIRTMGGTIPPMRDEAREAGTDELGQPIVEHTVTRTEIPYYCPNRYPVILIKNTSRHGKFLGDSDIDKIIWQQNTTNRLSAKIIDLLIQAGSIVTLPPRASLKEDSSVGKVLRIKNPAEMQMINHISLEGNITQDLTYLNQVYEEARQIIGVTDSFQGRHDPTATSGKAKEFAAAQSAGRLESKRVMRNAAYAELFRLMFLFKLAYTDEPRPLVADDVNGDKEYTEFSRYDFLRQDENGSWYWVDDSYFLFSTDVTAPLANNREAMWQETRQNLQMGAFGDPASYQTLVMYWGKMAQLHYPGAEETKRQMEALLQEQQMQMEAQQAQMEAQMQAQQAAQTQPMEQAPEEGMALPPQLQQAIEEQARRQAMRDMGA